MPTSATPYHPDFLAISGAAALAAYPSSHSTPGQKRGANMMRRADDLYESSGGWCGDPRLFGEKRYHELKPSDRRRAPVEKQTLSRLWCETGDTCHALTGRRD
ncbi:hypothetical protein B0H63DRAFT_505875 [Podospora didyma]|uniref:Uncharacterized protein n=1 Tax=Podospora didyma TaxID=330526 RepID=A0AAE0P6E1_9PEZI|nr:hypothetical protein B0H63DRAFT_505875 [Podospora didyma]